MEPCLVMSSLYRNSIEQCLSDFLFIIGIFDTMENIDVIIHLTLWFKFHCKEVGIVQYLLYIGHTPILRVFWIRTVQYGGYSTSLRVGTVGYSTLLWGSM